MRQKLLAWPFLLIKLKTKREPVDFILIVFVSGEGTLICVLHFADVFVNLARFAFIVQGAAARVTARLWCV